MLYFRFFEKNWKIGVALRAPPLNPHWPSAAWGSTPELLLPSPFIVTLLKRFVALMLICY